MEIVREQLYTVSELNKKIKGYLEGASIFNEFFLKGEISNINYYKSGHLYFTLKDKGGQIKCVAFNYKYKKISADLKEGDTIKLFGDIGVYEVRGEYQVLVRYIQKEDSIGALFEKLERVKLELKEGGYFEREHKKKLPKLPLSIGIVTSGSGAAKDDIINTARLRYPNIDIYLYPSQVQGEGSIKEVIKGIGTLDKLKEVDIIIAGRGGGSIEDLWTFNEKEVALAYFNAKKPIVSAVGHEMDNLLTDLVADLRASTPTHAAELVVPKKSDLKQELTLREAQLKKGITHFLTRLEESLDNRKNHPSYRNFPRVVEEKAREIVQREADLKRAFEISLANKKQNMEIRKERLTGLNPKRILDLGYSITLLDGKLVKDKKGVKKGDVIQTVFAKNKVESQII